eukprot:Pgem_evm1s10035
MIQRQLHANNHIINNSKLVNEVQENLLEDDDEAKTMVMIYRANEKRQPITLGKCLGTVDDENIFVYKTERTTGYGDMSQEIKRDSKIDLNDKTLQNVRSTLRNHISNSSNSSNNSNNNNNTRKKNDVVKDEDGANSSNSNKNDNNEEEEEPIYYNISLIYGNAMSTDLAMKQYFSHPEVLERIEEKRRQSGPLTSKT